MKLLKVIEKRRSVREYKEKPISMEQLDAMLRILETPVSLEAEQQTELLFIEDGENVYNLLNGVAGYHGVMIRAPHYFAVLAEPKGHYLANAGYLAEWFVLNATKLDLGTCWIETVDKSDKVKELLCLEDPRVIVALLAVGLPGSEHRTSNIFDTTRKGSLSPLVDLGYPEKNPEYSKAPVSARVSIEEIVYLKTWGTAASVETLESYGLAEAFYYMHLAPSWGNLQPWRFVVDGGRILLAICKENPYNVGNSDEALAAIQGGIAMLYFEVAMHDLGLPGKWNLDVNDGSCGVPEDYLIAGIYQYQ